MQLARRTGWANEGPASKNCSSEAPVVTDGAWGSQFLASGLAPDELRRRLEPHSSRARRGRPASLRGGGQPIILTNTFRSNRITLDEARARREDRGDQSRRRRDLPPRCRGRAPASSPPSAPRARCSSRARSPARSCWPSFGEQVEILAEAGADALVIETMSDLEEARIAVEAARRKPGCPWWPAWCSTPGRTRTAP